MSLKNTEKTRLTAPSEELSFILGVLIGDGSIFFDKTHNQGVICLVSIDLEFVEEFNRCISFILRKKRYKIYQFKSNYGTTLYRVTAYSRNFYELYITKDIKPFKIVANKFPSPFIRGFLDSDGSVSFRFHFDKRNGKRYPLCTVQMYNSHLEYLNLIQSLLIEHFGIDIKINKHTRSGFREELNLSQYNGYRCEIAKQSDIIRFYDEIGFTIKRKQRILKEGVEYLQSHRKIRTRNEKGQFVFIKAKNND